MLRSPIEPTQASNDGNPNSLSNLDLTNVFRFSCCLICVAFGVVAPLFQNECNNNMVHDIEKQQINKLCLGRALLPVCEDQSRAPPPEQGRKVLQRCHRHRPLRLEHVEDPRRRCQALHLAPGRQQPGSQAPVAVRGND